MGLPMSFFDAYAAQDELLLLHSNNTNDKNNNNTTSTLPITPTTNIPPSLSSPSHGTLVCTFKIQSTLFSGDHFFKMDMYDDYPTIPEGTTEHVSTRTGHVMGTFGSAPGRRMEVDISVQMSSFWDERGTETAEPIYAVEISCASGVFRANVRYGREVPLTPGRGFRVQPVERYS